MTELPDWQRGMALMGEHAPGDLRIIRLDDAGRISAFVIDSSDAWGRMLSVGNAELAARLGSRVNYDRRGQVAFIEGFDVGLQRWQAIHIGTGSGVEISTDCYVNGGYSVKLTGGSDGLRLAYINHWHWLMYEGNIGVELGFCMPGNVEYFEARLSVFDGAVKHEAGMRFSDAADKLEVQTGDGIWTEIADAGTLGRRVGMFNYFKFVIDPTTHRYVRALFNRDETDVSAHSYYYDDLVHEPEVLLDLRLYSRNTENDVVYVDNVILTAAEPE